MKECWCACRCSQLLSLIQCIELLKSIIRDDNLRYCSIMRYNRYHVNLNCNWNCLVQGHPTSQCNNGYILGETIKLCPGITDLIQNSFERPLGTIDLCLIPPHQRYEFSADSAEIHIVQKPLQICHFSLPTTRYCFAKTRFQILIRLSVS